jgi:hypothetical protein
MPGVVNPGFDVFVCGRRRDPVGARSGPVNESFDDSDGSWSSRTSMGESCAACLDRFDEMARTGRDLMEAEARHGATVVTQWQTTIGSLQALQQQLVSTGRWRGGPRTLLAALGVQHLELAMTAGLAWLLRPDGHHGLGDSVLRGLLAHLGAPAEAATGAVRIELEETRDKTRADLVVYGSKWTLVVEAKTFAPEQPGQLDRLHRHWQAEPEPYFVFLTRRGRPAKTAADSGDAWRAVIWGQIVEIALTAATSATNVSPGVYEYLATLEVYHVA